MFLICWEYFTSLLQNHKTKNSYDQRKIRSIQRWRNCNYYYDYGTGNESAAWRFAGIAETFAARVYKLYTQFCKCCYLLEQSPPHVSCYQQGKCRCALDEYSSSILAFSFSLRCWLDG